MTTIRFIAHGNNGATHFIRSPHPRKWLLEYYGVKHADKMYIGDGEHCGWIIATVWLTVFRVQPLEQQTQLI